MIYILSVVLFFAGAIGGNLLVEYLFERKRKRERQIERDKEIIIERLIFLIEQHVKEYHAFDVTGIF